MSEHGADNFGNKIGIASIILAVGIAATGIIHVIRWW